MVLRILQRHFGEWKNEIAKFAKAFRRVEKWFCEICKGISASGKMVLRILQRHFGEWKNEIAKFAKAFRQSEKWVCENDKGV